MSPPSPHIPGSPRMERGPHGERCPHPETFLTYLPGSPVKELPPRSPPRSLFREQRSIPIAPVIHLSKSPVDELSSRFPKQDAYGKRCPSPEPFSTYPSGSPTREPSLQVLFTDLPTSRAPFNHISESPVDEPTPGCPTEPP